MTRSMPPSTDNASDGRGGSMKLIGEVKKSRDREFPYLVVVTRESGDVLAVLPVRSEAAGYEKISAIFDEISRTATEARRKRAN